MHHNIRLLSVTLPSYADLLDYSPAKVEQPQPTDSILVPRECIFDVKLKCPPDMEITRLPILEQAISSLQDHHPPNIEEDDYIQVINTSPECIEISSDSDVVILECNETGMNWIELDYKQ